MEEGGRLLVSLVTNGSVVDYKNARLRSDYFIADEEALFSVVDKHVHKYHVLPAMETVKDQFKALPKAPESSQYYYDQTLQRFQHRKMNGMLMEANELMKHGDVWTTRQRAAETLAMLDETEASRAIEDFRTQGFPAVLKHYHESVYQKKAPGMWFGWERFDKHCEGVGDGELVSMVGRPGLGKTFLTLRAPLYTWRYKGGRPMYISMEMPVLDIHQRLTAMFSSTPLKPIQSSNLSSYGIKELTGKMAGMKDIHEPFWIVDGRSIKTPEDVRTIVALLRPTLVAVDSAARMGNKDRRLNRYERVGVNCEYLADEVYGRFGIPGYHSYHLSREAAKKIAKGKDEPDLEDIAFSDEVGKVSSLVLALFEEDGIEQMVRRKVSIMKGRRGQRGHFFIDWNFHDMGFDEIDPDADKTPQDMKFV